MLLDINVHLDYAVPADCDMLVQLEVASLADQHIVSSGLETSPVDQFGRIAGHDAIGERIWMQASQKITCEYTARVDVQRSHAELATAAQVPLHRVPADVVQYLLASRYCPSDEMEHFADSEIEGLTGGARIAAMSRWVEENFDYVPGSSTSRTTAIDTFVHRQGVCRDFAHVLITLARASAIPARIASVYAPDVTPQDFHATVQVWLDGGWHLVDPTGMATPQEMAIIGVGRDAADVSFLTTYGLASMNAQSVAVTRR